MFAFRAALEIHREESMGTSEWTVISTGLVILVAGAGAFRALRQEMQALRRELRQEIADSHGSVNRAIEGLQRQFDELRKDMGELRERMAKLEGLLEGLRESIAGRHVA
jgi:chromosome segregation ATPase